MTFTESIRTCFSKYATFEGRASRSEYWWFMLFVLLVGAGTAMISIDLSNLFHLATLLPSLAAACRRLHDTNRSGWLQLIMLIPLVGWLVLIYLLVQKPTEPNRFTLSGAIEGDAAK
jgi:uncharacterized membrane protein YhaH (DUF805 family)